MTRLCLVKRALLTMNLLLFRGNVFFFLNVYFRKSLVKCFFKKKIYDLRFSKIFLKFYQTSKVLIEILKVKNTFLINCQTPLGLD